MWPRFSFTACSANGTKFAPITGTFTALQYCRTDACSSACACWFMAAPPRATDRNHSVPASDARSVPANRFPEAVARHVSVLAPSADAAPPPHPSSPAPTLAQSLFATLPNRVAALDAATRSSRVCLSACRAVPVSSAITDQNSPASDRARATVSAVSSLPTPPAFSPARPDNAPDPVPPDDARSCARDAPRSAVRARLPHMRAAVAPASSFPPAAELSSGWSVLSRTLDYPPPENWFPPARTPP